VSLSSLLLSLILDIKFFLVVVLVLRLVLQELSLFKLSLFGLLSVITHMAFNFHHTSLVALSLRVLHLSTIVLSSLVDCSLVLVLAVYRFLACS